MLLHIPMKNNHTKLQLYYVHSKLHMSKLPIFYIHITIVIGSGRTKNTVWQEIQFYCIF